VNRSHAREWSAATEVSTSARHVYLLLAAHADPAGNAWPSVATLAAMVKRNRDTVRVALRELEASGDVVPSARKGASTVYYLPRLPATYPAAQPVGGVAGEPVGGSRKTGSNPAAQPRQKELKDAMKGNAGAAAPPQRAAAGTVHTNDRGETASPGSGWIKPVTHSDRDVGPKLTAGELAARREAAGLPPRRKPL
jgi:hypothetical protein